MKYVGDTQKLIDALYALGDKTGPILICVDGIDEFCNKRNQFLASMSGMTLYPYTLTAVASYLPQDFNNALCKLLQMKCFTGSDLITSVTQAVYKISCFVYKDVILRNEGFDEREKGVEGQTVPVSYVVGNLTDDILMQRKIKLESPSYSINKIERLNEISRKVGAITPFHDGRRDNKQEQHLCLINLLGCSVAAFDVKMTSYDTINFKFS